MKRSYTYKVLPSSRTDGYNCKNVLCQEKLAELFNIPPLTYSVDVVLSTEPEEECYAIRQGSSGENAQIHYEDRWNFHILFIQPERDLRDFCETAKQQVVYATVYI